MRALVIFLATGLAAAPALGAMLAADAASDAGYGSGWTNGSNGGTGFSPWVFRSDAGSGFAGFFRSSASNTDVSIGTGDNRAWGTFANGSGFNAAVAFRGFTDGSLSVGQSLLLSIDNGNIQTNGSMGIVLRTGNSNGAHTNYNTGSRFEFYFLGGQSGYRIVDGTGTTVTDIGFTSAGLDLTFTLTSANTYDLTVFRRSTSQTFTFLDRTLGGTAGAGLDSIALYNRDTESANVYFNSLEIIPEPTAVALLMVGAAIAMVRRRAAA